MAEVPPGDMSASDRGDLLAGIDDAFEQVLHGRYGGSIELTMLRDPDERSTDMLRVPATGREGGIRLLLQPSGARHIPADAGGVIVGRVTLSPPPAASIDDVTILSEVLDSWDANEAADASFWGTGVTFAALPDGGLAVVRSVQAAAAGGQSASRQQRGWLPQQQRQKPSRALGLGSNGHRRAPGSAVLRPVSADLLGRLGAAVAKLGAKAEAGAAFGAMTLVVQTGAEPMG